MAIADYRTATEADFVDSWTALALVFSESVPGDTAREIYRTMIMGERWNPEGLKRAVADCIKTLRFFPKPAELLMAYELWLTRQAFAARSGVTPALPAPEPTPEELSLHQRRMAVLREYMHGFTARTPAEQREYVEQRKRLARECEERGVPYLTELQERLQAAGIAPVYRGREQTWRCLRCRDHGRVVDPRVPVGAVGRDVACSCGGRR